MIKSIQLKEMNKLELETKLNDNLEALQNLNLLSKLLGGEDENLLIFPTIQLLATEIPLSAA